MKRFILFVTPDYYPGGGAYDYAGEYDTLPYALLAAESAEMNPNQSAHVLDTLTGYVHFTDNTFRRIEDLPQ